MNYTEAMRELESCGSEQTARIYTRHGATQGMVFGVSFANINRIAKAIKQDHPLARELWRSGNYDARNLAIKVCEPGKMQADELQDWVSGVDNYAHAGFMGEIAARSTAALQLLPQWATSKHEYVKCAGFSLLGSLAKAKPDALEDKRAADFVNQIEREIHNSPNWARYGMNWALIAVGTYKRTLTPLVMESAERIGKVHVDHGQTNCKTPDAIPYIKKSIAHLDRKKTASPA